MRSPFLWWCKCKLKSLKVAFNRDPMMVVSCVAVPLVVGLMFWISATDGLIARVG